jgi:hypothetical protein
MTPPKEKANEMYHNFMLGAWGKENATKCVDEILNELASFGVIYPSRLYEDRKQYWLEVKKELSYL